MPPDNHINHSALKLLIIEKLNKNVLKIQYIASFLDGSRCRCCLKELASWPSIESTLSTAQLRLCEAAAHTSSGSFVGESGGEFSRPYFKLKCDGDRLCLRNSPLPGNQTDEITVDSQA